MSLREGAIEAGAEAYLESWVEHDRRGKGRNVAVSVHMAVALDAILDYLEANAEGHAGLLTVSPVAVHRLIAALRMSSGVHEGKNG